MSGVDHGQATARSAGAGNASAGNAGIIDGPHSGPLLQTRKLVKRFGRFVAVSDVSIEVNPGEVVGLLGANGAGKTTLIRIALGLLAPTSGETLLLGQYPQRDVRRHVGYVPQGLGLYADLSVQENLDFVASVYRVGAVGPPPELAALSDRLVGSISLGAQRKLAFACALLHDPVLLVLDEPTSGVGALARTELWETIHARAARGVGVLVTTHYMQEAQQCDRLLLMSGGELVGSGDEADIIGDTTAVEVRAEQWELAFTALADAGLPVTLAGTSVRVADFSVAHVSAALQGAGVAGEVVAVPATIEERMTVLAGRLRGEV